MQLANTRLSAGRELGRPATEQERLPTEMNKGLSCSANHSLKPRSVAPLSRLRECLVSCWWPRQWLLSSKRHVPCKVIKHVLNQYIPLSGTTTELVQTSVIASGLWSRPWCRCQSRFMWCGTLTATETWLCAAVIAWRPWQHQHWHGLFFRTVSCSAGWTGSGAVFSCRLEERSTEDRYR